ncbi:hypothetical protein ZOSMA_7G01680 [Zostera marina]|uniref:Uncharacterized protein n=1 Tax=Zostera marina TaxID=29655 RepID=A0A0K9NQ01_ZOSMR|nr:hypothetical protein ZOSMA_7G01680 [Zostera marina]
MGTTEQGTQQQDAPAAAKVFSKPKSKAETETDKYIYIYFKLKIPGRPVRVWPIPVRILTFTGGSQGR